MTSGAGLHDLLDVRRYKSRLPYIDNLEKQGKFFVTRHKKSGSTRFVWSDDASLFFSIDQESITLWHDIKAPDGPPPISGRTVRTVLVD